MSIVFPSWQWKVRVTGRRHGPSGHWVAGWDGNCRPTSHHFLLAALHLWYETAASETPQSALTERESWIFQASTHDSFDQYELILMFSLHDKRIPKNVKHTVSPHECYYWWSGMKCVQSFIQSGLYMKTTYIQLFLFDFLYTTWSFKYIMWLQIFALHSGFPQDVWP